MADWNVDLPDEASLGDPGHVEDHNAIVDAVREVRSAVDAVEQTANDAAPASHQHDAGDITSGTLAAARIPNRPISAVTGLQAALDALAQRIDQLENPDE